MLDLAECITIADGACDILLNRLGNEPEMKGRSGGFLCIADKKGQVLLLTQIGDVPEEMLGRYSRNAVEKAQRLAWTSQYALAAKVVTRRASDGLAPWRGGTTFSLSRATLRIPTSYSRSSLPAISAT